MADITRVGIIGAGWPGLAHARGYREAGGFQIAAVADLIPERRRQLLAQFGPGREYADAMALVADHDIDAVSVCLPSYLHEPVVRAALKAGKHVLCEVPPAPGAAEMRHIAAAARKAGRVVLFAFQRRFGGHEQAAQRAIDKGFIGEPYHIRAAWTRTRGIPAGTGWYTQKARSGGGPLIDLGCHMLDLGWSLLGRPRPVSAFAITHRRLVDAAASGGAFDVEDAAFALVRFEAGRCIELATSWALNQPDSQNGTVCRVHGTDGAIEVYTPQGAVLYREQNGGRFSHNPLTPPRLTHYPAMMRHFRQCIAGKATPLTGPAEAMLVMEVIEALYRSAESGRSVSV
jgi:predicted dehydrogenase